jgi:hypothetical protein
MHIYSIIMEDAGGDDLASKPKIDLVGACVNFLFNQVHRTMMTTASEALTLEMQLGKIQ